MEPPPQPTDAIRTASKNRKPQMRGESRMKTPRLNVFRRSARLLLGCIESIAATVTIASKTAHFYTQKCSGIASSQADGTKVMSQVDYPF
jgi:hypothetical protein